MYGCTLHPHVMSTETHDCEICGKTFVGCKPFEAHKCQPKVYCAPEARLAKDLSLGEAFAYLAALEAEYADQPVADRAMAL